ncbi:DUF459 domain-containing protein [Stenotrophomonas sp.]|uniref:SGNH/GDSL hydrolase family protein n=1 Tax=Stenotrophomonas sp. TaxID=69392 RepID=UPI0028A5BC43|nr:DUF459 domain-containing protein [Stenotrophomonas sp.]
MRLIPGWSAGRQAWSWLVEKQKDHATRIGSSFTELSDSFNQRFVLTDAYQNRLREVELQALAKHDEGSSESEALLEHERKSSYLSLTAADRVLMAGDSLMQGVAPHLLRDLDTQHAIKSSNLSRQSTGLSYPGLFDWPATIDAAVDADPSIRLVVVMLGPNDPWDMPDPMRTGSPFLKFQSVEWEAAYRSRVARIIDNSAARRVNILWVGSPGMRRAKLDDQMQWLMSIIQDEVESRGAVFLDTRQHLPGARSPDGYQDSVAIGAKMVKMRSADGIHFSVAGQKYLAQRVLEALSLPP